MQVCIELKKGSEHTDDIKQADIQKNLDALERYVSGNPLSNDDVLLIDTMSILMAIQNKLPRR